MRTLLEHRTPPPVSLDDYTHSRLTSSILDYISRPFSTELVGEGMAYLPLVNELLAPPLTPYICYTIIPHLRTLELNLGVFIETLLTGIIAGNISPSFQLMYVVLELVHSRLTLISQTALTQYLRLLALLLDNVQLDHMTSTNLYEEEEDDESMEEGESDPLTSAEELRKCCVTTITGDKLAIRVKQER